MAPIAITEASNGTLPELFHPSGKPTIRVSRTYCLQLTGPHLNRFEALARNYGDGLEGLLVEVLMDYLRPEAEAPSPETQAAMDAKLSELPL